MKDSDITIFEPCKYHYYQPGWTMVGGNIYDQKFTVKLTRKVFHRRINIVPYAVD